MGRKALLITLALRMYEDSLCGSCMQPGHLAYDQFNTGEFEAKTVTCLGCEARERYAEDEKLGPGEKVYVHNHIDEAVT